MLYNFIFVFSCSADLVAGSGFQPVSGNSFLPTLLCVLKLFFCLQLAATNCPAMSEPTKIYIFTLQYTIRGLG